MSVSNVTQPLIRSQARYTVEVARCVVFGVLLSALCAVLYFALLPQPETDHRGLVVVLSVLVFPPLYAFAGYRRGVRRALASLARSHGTLLYDHTLGRFVETIEARRPGSFTAALSSPAKLVQNFRIFLHECPAMPRMIRRVALPYVGGLGRQLGDASFVKDEVVVDGRVNVAAFRHWAVQRMREQAMPSWRLFGCVLAVQVAATGALVWVSR